MKKIPLILLLTAPYIILIVCYQANLDLSIGLYIYGALLAFHVAYAFLMPKLGFNGKQILFWNLLLKRCNIPLVLLIQLFTLIMTVIGGEGIRDEVSSMVMISLLACYIIQLSSAMFGISGFAWCRKYGTLSKAGMVASTIAQLIPVVDVLGSVLCYIMFRNEGKSASNERNDD